MQTVSHSPTSATSKQDKAKELRRLIADSLDILGQAVDMRNSELRAFQVSLQHAVDLWNYDAKALQASLEGIAEIAQSIIEGGNDATTT